MIDKARTPPKNRCLLLLILATLCAGLFWILAHQLINAIYQGNAGNLLNPLITGQATHSLEQYHAGFSRLHGMACAIVLLPLLACSLLPQRISDAIGRLASRLVCCARKGLGTLSHLPAPLLPILLLAVAGTVVLSRYWYTSARIPANYGLGHITPLAGPADCNGQPCYELEVTCAELGSSEKVRLRLGLPAAGVPGRGTILFFSGWTGNYWWQWDSDPVAPDDAEANAEDRRIRANHKMIIDELRAAGFLTVDVKWERGWFIADEGNRENPPLLACKPATLVQWVYDELHDTSPDRAFCATGHSNGAAELAYLLSRYGMDEILSLVIMEAGPNWSRLDYACLQDEDNETLFDSDNGRNTSDLAFGYPNDGSGICARQKSAWSATFRRTSVAVDGEWNYRYPATQIAFLFGTDDHTVTARHGEYYRDWLEQAGTPLLTRSSAGGAHVPSGDTAGAAIMRDLFLNECRPR